MKQLGERIRSNYQVERERPSEKSIFINYLLVDLTRLKEENRELKESIERLEKENTDLKEIIATQDVEIAGLKGDEQVKLCTVK